MKPRQSKGGGRTPEGNLQNPKRNILSITWFALTFGLFLGLCILKFGNPVILDEKVGTPANLEELLSFAWPTRWAYWGLIPLLLVGGVIVLMEKAIGPGLRWLWLLPIIWFSWQLVSATHTVDAELTRVVIWQFAGCIGCYFVGLFVFRSKVILPWLLAGILAAFAWCLVRAANQKLIEFPRERAELIAGEQCGWTNLPPEMVSLLKSNQFIVTTNGVDVANPVILAKYAKGRVHGTVVYPNALAGLIILLLPVSLVLAVARTRQLRWWIRAAGLALVLFLGLGGLYWTGSKLGWLVGLSLAGIWLLRLDWPRGLKVALIALVIAGGMGMFAWRFHGYFSSGAKSVGARFDYWRAATTIFADHTVFGTGPGTFQRPYELIRAPESEMARLAHNDYLEQFSDSGLVGGMAYLGWIAVALICVIKNVKNSPDLVCQGLALGLLGWFVQGFGEFSLYVPALAWTAFAFLGTLVAHPNLNAVDSPEPAQ